MAASLLVYIAAIMVVVTTCRPEKRPQNICYTTVKSVKNVSVTRSSTTWRGRVYYKRQYVTQAYYTTAQACCRGYQLDARGTCVPVCKPGCPPPKVCYAPSSCRCPSNLVEDAGGECISPLCLSRPCESGKCNPNSGVCICDSGYRWIGDKTTGRCEPSCQGGCGDGGQCSAPNECTCSEGFRKAPTGIACEPTTCPKGYVLKSNGTSGLRTCQPWCASGCPNGTCSAPDTCECHVGYRPSKDKDGASTCVAMPRCWVNGYLAEHDTCRCLPGYKLVDSNEGLPTCMPDCGDTCGRHATCVAPDTCKCLPGYVEKAAQYDYPSTFWCEPHCTFGCGRGGKCVAPGECRCGKSHSCVNASCLERPRGACSCWYNYEQVPGEPSKCRPICHPPCAHGTCVSPGRCICSQGYEMNRGRCVPKCKNTCGYGECVAPDQCKCWEGYELATDETGHTKCVPACKPPCVHGQCTHPNVCECLRGYQMKGSSCEPVCTRPCTNAECVEPDTCRCWDGYERTPADETYSVCQPTCNATCVNATCTAPNTCSCQEGLVHDSEDPSRATCGLPCPGHLCSDQGPEGGGCLPAGGHHDCVCATGRKLLPCSSEAHAAPRRQTPWLVLLLLPPALVVVALLSFLYIRKRRKNQAAAPAPSTVASEVSSPNHSTSDEYDDVSSYSTTKLPIDTKKLIKRAKNHHQVTDPKAARSQGGEDCLYEQIAGGRSSPVYGEIDADISSGKPEPGSSKSADGSSQMTENEFYGASGDKEWSRGSVQVIDNNLYSLYDRQPERNTIAEADLNELYAKVAKKGNKRSSAKIIANDIYSQPSKNGRKNASGKTMGDDMPSGSGGEKSTAQQPDGHYEELTGTFRAVEIRENRRERPTEEDEEQEYAEIGDVRSKVLSELVDNDLYRRKSARQEVEGDYEEIPVGAGRGAGEMLENSLYQQTGHAAGNSNLASELTENDLYSTNATDIQKSNLRAKVMKRKGHKKT